MAINVQHTYCTHVTIFLYAEDGMTVCCKDCGTMDDIQERVCELLVKHNFVSADVCSEEMGEILMIVERT